MKKSLSSVVTLLSVISLSTAVFSCNQPGDNKTGSHNDKTAQTANPQKNAEFAGNWKVADGDGTVFYVVLKPDATATSTWGEGQHGTWKLIGDKAQVTWSDGWVNVIYKSGTAYKKNAYAPGAHLDGMPTNSSSAEKVATVPPTTPAPAPKADKPATPPAAPATTPSGSSTQTSWKRS
jgi:hypothetical protein